MWQPVLDACHIIFKINPSKCYLFNLWAWFSVNRTHLTATFSHNLYLIINFLINARSIIVARKWIEWQKFATKLTQSICFWGLSEILPRADQTKLFLSNFDYFGIFTGIKNVIFYIVIFSINFSIFFSFRNFCDLFFFELKNHK